MSFAPFRLLLKVRDFARKTKKKKLKHIRIQSFSQFSTVKKFFGTVKKIN